MAWARGCVPGVFLGSPTLWLPGRSPHEDGLFPLPVAPAVFAPDLAPWKREAPFSKVPGQVQAPAHVSTGEDVGTEGWHLAREGVTAVIPASILLPAPSDSHSPPAAPHRQLCTSCAGAAPWEGETDRRDKHPGKVWVPPEQTAQQHGAGSWGMKAEGEEGARLQPHG